MIYNKLTLVFVKEEGRHMKHFKKICTLIFSLILIFSNSTTLVFASTPATTESPDTISASKNIIPQLNEASIMLETGAISEKEYTDKLIEIYNLDNLNTSNQSIHLAAANSAYYPEVQCGYINYSGVKYLHNTGLKKAKTADAAIRLLIGAIPGCGWGLSAIAVASAYGGHSSLEKAVNSAYSKKKGIKVYYKIHKGVTSMNKVRYVVG